MTAPVRLKSCREWLGDHWLTLLSVVALGAVFWNVGQVRNLFEFPDLGVASPGPAVLFCGYVALLFLVYVWAGWYVVPKGRPPRPVLALEPTFRARLAHWRGEFRAWWKDVRESVWTALGQRRGVLSGVLMVVGGLCVWGACGTGPQAGFLPDSSVLGTFALLFLGLALVLLLKTCLHEFTFRMLTRSLGLLILLNAAGEVIWALPEFWSLPSYRMYSMWAVLHVAFSLFLFARVIDAWQSSSDRLIRPLALVLAVIALGRMQPSPVGTIVDSSSLAAVAAGGEADLAGGPPPAARPEPLAESDLWLEHLQRRLRAIPDDGGPAVFVAASGGGSRAALFTALVYEYLQRTPISFTAAGGTQTYNVADHIVLISSVSGGTLASACYLDSQHRRRRARTDGTRPAPLNFMLDDILHLMKASSRGLESTVYDAGHLEQTRTACEKADTEKPHWFLQRELVDDMCTDFMAPLLRGALHPGRDRAHAVQAFWEAKFGLSETNLDWHRDLDRTGRVPLLLCNVCEVERGSCLIIGFPPLPPRFMVDPQRPAPFRELQEADIWHQQWCQVRLSEATRLSANFPWGFPVAEINFAAGPAAAEDPADTAGAAISRSVHLIDGGVFDNTGIGALRYVVEGLDRLAQEPEADRALRHRAAAILCELQRRGVVLLEIDSGAKPEPPGTFARLLSGVLEPVRALQNAGYASAEATNQNDVESLQRLLPDPAARRVQEQIRALERHSPASVSSTPRLEPPGNVSRIIVQCNHDRGQDSVMTAWALGPLDKAKVFVRFLVGTHGIRDELQKTLEDRAKWTQSLSALQSMAVKEPGAAPVPAETAKTLSSQFQNLSLLMRNRQAERDKKATLQKRFFQGLPLDTEPSKLRVPTDSSPTDSSPTDETKSAPPTAPSPSRTPPTTRSQPPVRGLRPPATGQQLPTSKWQPPAFLDGYKAAQKVLEDNRQRLDRLESRTIETINKLKKIHQPTPAPAGSSKKAAITP